MGPSPYDLSCWFDLKHKHNKNFRKSWFWKKSANDKAWTIFPGGKELSQTLDSEHLEYILASTQDFGTNCTCAKPPLIFCMLGNCSCFCCRLLTFFKMNFFKKFFQELYQSVKQFGSRSGPMFCRSWSGLWPDDKSRH